MKIEIETLTGGGFDVRVDDRNTEQLTLGEMLEVVVCLTTPGPRSERRCLQWLKTDQEREQQRIALQKAREEREAREANEIHHPCESPRGVANGRGSGLDETE